MATVRGDLEHQDESQNRWEEEQEDRSTDVLPDVEHDTIIADLRRNLRLLPTPHTSEQRGRGMWIAFAAHSVAVYICALHVSPWLIAHWFSWILPALNSRVETGAGDWYLQHLASANIIPTLVIGYIAGRRTRATARWAWVIPSLILAYEVIQYRPASALIRTTAMEYFFKTGLVMPDATDVGSSITRQVLAQMTITAPFYAGLAYSIGAWVSNYAFITNLFRFQKKAF